MRQAKVYEEVEEIVAKVAKGGGTKDAEKVATEAREQLQIIPFLKAIEICRLWLEKGDV